MRSYPSPISARWPIPPDEIDPIDPVTCDGAIPEGYPEWWRPGMTMPSWWKPGDLLGDESIELDEEDGRTVDAIWDDLHCGEKAAGGRAHADPRRRASDQGLAVPDGVGCRRSPFMEVASVASGGSRVPSGRYAPQRMNVHSSDLPDRLS